MLGVIFLEYKGGDGLLTKNACYHWADGEIMVGVMCDMCNGARLAGSDL